MKPLRGTSPAGLLASRTLTRHLLRGAIAAALLYAAISQQDSAPGWSVLAGLLAFVAMRGCPACWTIGLVETICRRAAPTVDDAADPDDSRHRAEPPQCP